MFVAEQVFSVPTSASRGRIQAASTVWRVRELPREKCHTVSHAALQASLAKVAFSCQNADALCCLRYLGESRVFSWDSQSSEEQPSEARRLQSCHTRAVNGFNYVGNILSWTLMLGSH